MSISNHGAYYENTFWILSFRFYANASWPWIKSDIYANAQHWIKSGRKNIGVEIKHLWSQSQSLAGKAAAASLTPNETIAATQNSWHLRFLHMDRWSSCKKKERSIRGINVKASKKQIRQHTENKRKLRVKATSLDNPIALLGCKERKATHPIH